MKRSGGVSRCLGLVLLIAFDASSIARGVGPTDTAPAGNGLFVAVGYGGFRGWSADGQNWSAERWSAKNEDDINIIFSLVYRDGIFLCSGGGVGKGFILRSTDGKHWDEVVRTKWRIAGVTTLPDRFFSIYDDHFYESKDGLKWTELAEAKAVAPDGNGGGYFRRSAVGKGAVVFAGDYALGPGPRIGWIGGTKGGTTPMTFQKEPADVRGLDFGNGRFVACTQNGHILSSVDGQEFKEVGKTEDEYDDAVVTFYQGNFYLKGRKTTQISGDGEHWTIEPKPPHIPRAISPAGISVDCGWGGITWSPGGKTWQKASVPIDPTGVCTIVYGVPRDRPEEHSAAEWLEKARDETAQQEQWESTHPQDNALFLGAGQYITGLYGKLPDAKIVLGTPEFIAWWKETGAAGLEQWAKDGFPMNLDRDHLIYNSIALYSAQDTPRTNPTLYVNGQEFSNPGRFWAYYDRIKKSGTEVLSRGCAGGKLSQNDYNLLRLFAPIPYSMWGTPYLPYEVKLTAGDVNRSPTPGMEAPDFTLRRLEPILRSRRYSDAYSFDYRRPFHSIIAAFLLEVCNGYEAIPTQERIPNGPVIRAKPYQCTDPDCVRLSSSRGKKPVLLVLNDPIDGYWSTTVGLMEPLYQATKDKIDWYFICDDIGDNIYWSDYYFKPSQAAGVTFQKAVSMEERGQTAKMMSMRYVNLSFPLLLDDMAQHAQNAYADQGGIAKVILIDKNGIISLNSRLFDEPRNYTQRGEFGYQMMAQVHCVVSANVKTLLDNNGLWNGKDAVIPNWEPPAKLENVKITNVDAKGGTIAVVGADGKEIVVFIDQGTRVIFTGARDLYKSVSDLTVGTTISCTYEPNASNSGRIARLILNGSSLNDFLSNSACAAAPVQGTDKLWCPAVATAISDSAITAVLARRPKSEIRGLNFWEEAGDQAKPQSTGWMIPIVKDWADRPDQILTFHVDRATEVILNGMKAKVSDIRVGDHLGVEFRAEQKPDNLRPYFVFVYRFGT